MADGARGEYVKEFTVEKPQAGANAVRIVSAERRLDTLGKLERQGKITPAQYCAGRDYLSIVETYYASASGLSRLSEEAPHAGGQSDPIRLYVKGRAARQVGGKVLGYVPTQKPRNVSRARTSFDGWSSSRLDALRAMNILNRALGHVDAESLLALYGLVIHPRAPERRCLSVSAYSKKRYGHDNARAMGRTIHHLAVALDALHKEYGERLEQAA